MVKEKPKEEEKKEEKPKQERYGLGRIATETEVVVVNNETDVTYTKEEALAEILNKLHKIEKALN